MGGSRVWWPMSGRASDECIRHAEEDAEQEVAYGGIGELPDASRYGDEGSDTLGNRHGSYSPMGHHAARVDELPD